MNYLMDVLGSVLLDIILDDYLRDMDLMTELQSVRSKDKVNRILEYIGSDVRKVDELMQCVLGDDKTLARCGSWVVYHLADDQSIDFTPYVNDLTDKVLSNPQQAIERALLKLLWILDSWPEDRYTEIVDHMMCIIMDTKSKIAAQALSMEALWKHLQPYPELLQELKLVLEEGMAYGSAGYKAKARKIIKSINKADN